MNSEHIDQILPEHKEREYEPSLGRGFDISLEWYEVDIHKFFDELWE